AAAPIVAPHLAALVANQPGPSARSAHGNSSRTQGTSPQVVTTLRDTGPASIQLDAQDLTPKSHLTISGAGFANGEQLSATIEDPLGHPYDRANFVADAQGRLRTATLALPPQLGAGDYRLLVMGNTSHRKASVTFHMYDVPPSVSLDAYTSKPG